MANNNAKIMEKIKKVLALSKNNPSEEEAAAALLMAQKLMMENNLTMEEVEGTEEKSKEAKTDYSVTSGATTGWKIVLAKIICDNFKTEVLKAGKGFCFIGMEDEVQLTVSLFNLASDIMDKGMKRIRRNARKAGKDTSGLAGDYAAGFLDGLKAKFDEQVQKEGWGLIPVKPEAVVQKKDQLTNGSKPVHIKDKLGRKGSMAAYQAGYQKGKNLKTNKQITA